MDMSAFLNTLLSTQSAVLPSATAMRVALHLVWAIVLGSGALLVAQKLARPYRLGLSLLVTAWTLVPGSASPAYWLGLAFQTPSLMSAGICLGWFLTRAWLGQGLVSGQGAVMAEPRVAALRILSLVGVVLGWVLLLDTLAWLPVSVYAWGFSSAAIAAVAVFATLLWIVFGATGANRRTTGQVGLVLPLVVLTLFVLTRLPTGNAWDALIDPWLWAALQLWWLGRGLRWLKAKLRPPPATRA